jgi:hypothetical protein
MAAAIGHDVWTNRRGRWAQRAGRLAVVAHDGLRLTALRHDGRTNRRGPMAIEFCKRRAPQRQVLRLKIAAFFA